MLFWAQHIPAAISEIHKALLQLNVFPILPQPRLTPAPTPHHPVYFYSRWQPSTYLSAIFYISRLVFFFISTALHHQHKRSTVEFFTLSHHLKSNSSLLCSTHPLCSLYGFPHPRHSSRFGSIRTQEVCDFLCMEAREWGRDDNHGLLQRSISVSQRNEWEGALQCFLFLFFPSRWNYCVRALKHNESVKASAPVCWRLQTFTAFRPSPLCRIAMFIQSTDGMRFTDVLTSARRAAHFSVCCSFWKNDEDRFNSEDFLGVAMMPWQNFKLLTNSNLHLE